MNAHPAESDRRLETEMIKLRYWQHIMNEDLKKKLFNIPINVAFGNEAIAIAVCDMMEQEDQLVLTHRNMAYNLVRAGALKPVYDEYKLSPDGIAAGKLGSMNLANPARGIAYASSILGNNFSLGCGLALSKRVKRDAGIVIVTTGDGAIEEGGFYEALVFAKSHELQLMIVLENNNHSMSSTIAQRRCSIGMAKLCESVHVPYQHLSGNDVFAYASTLLEVRAGMETGSNPVCVEAELTLLNQHAGPTPGWPTDPMSVDLKNGLIVRDEPGDPLYVLRQSIGEEPFAKMAAQVADDERLESVAAQATSER